MKLIKFIPTNVNLQARALSHARPHFYIVRNKKRIWLFTRDFGKISVKYNTRPNRRAVSRIKMN